MYLLYREGTIGKTLKTLGKEFAEQSWLTGEGRQGDGLRPTE